MSRDAITLGEFAACRDAFATIRFTVIHAPTRVTRNDQDFFDRCHVGSPVCELAIRLCSPADATPDGPQLWDSIILGLNQPKTTDPNATVVKLTF